MAVHIDGRLLGYMDRLEDHLKVGDQVTADLAPNAAADGGSNGLQVSCYIHGSPCRYVARAVFKARQAAYRRGILLVKSNIG